MIKIFNFRKNDLNPSQGKQIEFNQNVVSSFFQFGTDEVEINITYKSLDRSDVLNGRQFKNHLKLSPSRGDYKIYANPNGSENIKDLFLSHLNLNVAHNLKDYFALVKKDSINYDLYYIPASTTISSFLGAIRNDIFDFLPRDTDEVLLSASEYSTYSVLPIVVEDKVFISILFKAFKFIIERYGEGVVLGNSDSDKTTTIDQQEFKAITFPKYFNNKRIIILSDKELNKEQLTSSGTPRYFEENLELTKYPYAYFTTQWGDDDEASTLKSFNHLLKDISNNTLEIIKENDIYRLVNKGSKALLDNYQTIGENKIYFGAPGTGKSYAIKEQLIKNNVDGEHYARITFHPDFDYSSFIGGYKPYTDATEDNKIKYKFVPQIFIDLYVKAWSKPNESFYLVIEEINRGNCAEIFGDIFQLLDRNPEYNIEPSTELKEYLKTIEKEENVKLLFDGKLQMPARLSILASMNTSDQSLYPMDSAFKRRWEWEYIAINTECEKSNFIIKITDTHKYSWLEFLQQVNKKIYGVNKSEDKQIGNWFINATKTSKVISKPTFINKVLFYLWNDVFKDEIFHAENIFVLHNNDGSKQNISFNDFFNAHEQEKLLINLMESVLKVSPINESDKTEDQTENESTDSNNLE